MFIVFCQIHYGDGFTWSSVETEIIGVFTEDKIEDVVLKKMEDNKAMEESIIYYRCPFEPNVEIDLKKAVQV